MIGRIFVNTNDVIIGTVKKGSFHFPIEFNMFDRHQYIQDAIFDTGCSHSLISAKSLDTGDKSIEELKHDAIYDMKIKLSIGRGVESKDIDATQLTHDIKTINGYKGKLKEKGILGEKAKNILEKHITGEMLSRIEKSKLVRYEYTALNYKIDGIAIGDFNVKVSFDIAKSNLIGMHIIKELYTKIFCEGNQIFLLSVKNSPIAEDILNKELNRLCEELKLMKDEDVLRSNYVNTFNKKK